jgi:hypothetical protein
MIIDPLIKILHPPDAHQKTHAITLHANNFYWRVAHTTEFLDG